MCYENLCTANDGVFEGRGKWEKFSALHKIVPLFPADDDAAVCYPQEVESQSSHLDKSVEPRANTSRRFGTRIVSLPRSRLNFSGWKILILSKHHTFTRSRKRREVGRETAVSTILTLPRGGVLVFMGQSYLGASWPAAWFRVHEAQYLMGWINGPAGKKGKSTLLTPPAPMLLLPF